MRKWENGGPEKGGCSLKSQSESLTHQRRGKEPPESYFSLENIRKTSQLLASLVAQMVKYLPATWEAQVRSLGQEDPLEQKTVTHSSILGWRISWTEDPGDYSSWGLKVGHDSATIKEVVKKKNPEMHSPWNVRWTHIFCIPYVDGEEDNGRSFFHLFQEQHTFSLQLHQGYNKTISPNLIECGGMTGFLQT